MFYRGVGLAAWDQLARPYRDQIRGVQAGYFTKQNGRWAIQPARAYREAQQSTFCWVRVTAELYRACPSLTEFDDVDAYRPIFFPVRYTRVARATREQDRAERVFAEGVQESPTGVVAAHLVASGNMLETGKQGQQRSPRRNHCIVFEPDRQSQPLLIADESVNDYLEGRSDFQRGDGFNAELGMLVEGRPVFYVPPQDTDEVVLFGHSPNFRLPFRPQGAKRAARSSDYVPRSVRGVDSGIVDLADAVFGFVRPSGQGRMVDQAYAGRVEIDDARFVGFEARLHEEDQPITPPILGSPKATTFTHYLVQDQQASFEQTGVNNRGEPQFTLRRRSYLAKPEHDTVARGHKLYWHKGRAPKLHISDEQKRKAPKQTTLLCPLAIGVRFSFAIRLTNLSAAELGALLWVLDHASGPYRLALGMGKPHGMGAVQLTYTVHRTTAHSSNPGLPGRYDQLFANRQWHDDSVALSPKEHKDCLDAFHAFVLEGLRFGGVTLSGNPSTIDELHRIQCLLALLQWPGPDSYYTRYLEIERPAQQQPLSALKDNERLVNEYKPRRVLPSPLQVLANSDQNIQYQPTRALERSVGPGSRGPAGGPRNNPPPRQGSRQTQSPGQAPRTSPPPPQAPPPSTSPEVVALNALLAEVERMQPRDVSSTMRAKVDRLLAHEGPEALRCRVAEAIVAKAQQAFVQMKKVEEQKWYPLIAPLLAKPSTEG